MRPILDLMCRHDACLALELFANDGFEDIMPNMCVQGRQDIIHKNHLRAQLNLSWVVGRRVVKLKVELGATCSTLEENQINTVMNLLKVFSDGKVQKKILT